MNASGRVIKEDTNEGLIKFVDSISILYEWIKSELSHPIVCEIGVRINK